MEPSERFSDVAFRRLNWAIVIFAVLCLIAVCVPNFVNSQRRGPAAKANDCINNLRQIHVAANQFALEKGKTKGDAIHFPNDLTPYIKLNNDGKIPPCPSGGIYHIGRVGKAPTCSLGSTVTPAHIEP